MSERVTVADALAQVLGRVAKEAGLPWPGAWSVVAKVTANPGQKTLELTATLQAEEGAELLSLATLLARRGASDNVAN